MWTEAVTMVNQANKHSKEKKQARASPAKTNAAVDDKSRSKNVLSKSTHAPLKEGNDQKPGKSLQRSHMKRHGKDEADFKKIKDAATAPVPPQAVSSEPYCAPDHWTYHHTLQPPPPSKPGKVAMGTLSSMVTSHRQRQTGQGLQQNVNMSRESSPETLVRRVFDESRTVTNNNYQSSKLPSLPGRENVYPRIQRKTFHFLHAKSKSGNESKKTRCSQMNSHTELNTGCQKQLAASDARDVLTHSRRLSQEYIKRNITDTSKREELAARSKEVMRRDLLHTGLRPVSYLSKNSDRGSIVSAPKKWKTVPWRSQETVPSITLLPYGATTERRGPTYYQQHPQGYFYTGKQNFPSTYYENKYDQLNTHWRVLLPEPVQPYNKVVIRAMGQKVQKKWRRCGNSGHLCLQCQLQAEDCSCYDGMPVLESLQKDLCGNSSGLCLSGESHIQDDMFMNLNQVPAGRRLEKINSFRQQDNMEHQIMSNTAVDKITLNSTRARLHEKPPHRDLNTNDWGSSCSHSLQNQSSKKEPAGGAHKAMKKSQSLGDAYMANYLNLDFRSWMKQNEGNLSPAEVATERLKMIANELAYPPLNLQHASQETGQAYEATNNDVVSSFSKDSSTDSIASVNITFADNPEEEVKSQVPNRGELPDESKTQHSKKVHEAQAETEVKFEMNKLDREPTKEELDELKERLLQEKPKRKADIHNIINNLHKKLSLDPDVVPMDDLEFIQAVMWRTKSPEMLQFGSCFDLPAQVCTSERAIANNEKFENLTVTTEPKRKLSSKSSPQLLAYPSQLTMRQIAFGVKIDGNLDKHQSELSSRWNQIVPIKTSAVTSKEVDEKVKADKIPRHDGRNINSGKERKDIAQTVKDEFSKVAKTDDAKADKQRYDGQNINTGKERKDVAQTVREELSNDAKKDNASPNDGEIDNGSIAKQEMTVYNDAKIKSAILNDREIINNGSVDTKLMTLDESAKLNQQKADYFDQVKNKAMNLENEENHETPEDYGRNTNQSRNSMDEDLLSVYINVHNDDARASTPRLNDRPKQIVRELKRVLAVNYNTTSSAKHITKRLSTRQNRPILHTPITALGIPHVASRTAMENQQSFSKNTYKRLRMRRGFNNHVSTNASNNNNDKENKFKNLLRHMKKVKVAFKMSFDEVLKGTSIINSSHETEEKLLQNSSQILNKEGNPANLSNNNKDESKNSSKAECSTSEVLLNTTKCNNAADSSTSQLQYSGSEALSNANNNNTEGDEDCTSSQIKYSGLEVYLNISNPDDLDSSSLDQEYLYSEALLNANNSNNVEELDDDDDDDDDDNDDDDDDSLTSSDSEAVLNTSNNNNTEKVDGDDVSISDAESDEESSHSDEQPETTFSENMRTIQDALMMFKTKKPKSSDLLANKQKKLKSKPSVEDKEKSEDKVLEVPDANQGSTTDEDEEVSNSHELPQDGIDENELHKVSIADVVQIVPAQDANYEEDGTNVDEILARSQHLEVPFTAPFNKFFLMDMNTDNSFTSEEPQFQQNEFKIEIPVQGSSTPEVNRPEGDMENDKKQSSSSTLPTTNQVSIPETLTNSLLDKKTSSEKPESRDSGYRAVSDDSFGSSFQKDLLGTFKIKSKLGLTVPHWMHGGELLTYTTNIQHDEKSSKKLKAFLSSRNIKTYPSYLLKSKILDRKAGKKEEEEVDLNKSDVASIKRKLPAWELAYDYSKDKWVPKLLNHDTVLFSESPFLKRPYVLRDMSNDDGEIESSDSDLGSPSDEVKTYQSFSPSSELPQETRTAPRDMLSCSISSFTKRSPQSIRNDRENLKKLTSFFNNNRPLKEYQEGFSFRAPRIRNPNVQNTLDKYVENIRRTRQFLLQCRRDPLQLGEAKYLHFAQKKVIQNLSDLKYSTDMDEALLSHDKEQKRFNSNEYLKYHYYKKACDMKPRAISFLKNIRPKERQLPTCPHTILPWSKLSNEVDTFVKQCIVNRPIEEKIKPRQQRYVFVGMRGPKRKLAFAEPKKDVVELPPNRSIRYRLKMDATLWRRPFTPKPVEMVSKKSIPLERFYDEISPISHLLPSEIEKSVIDPAEKDTDFKYAQSETFKAEINRMMANVAQKSKLPPSGRPMVTASVSGSMKFMKGSDKKDTSKPHVAPGREPMRLQMLRNRGRQFLTEKPEDDTQAGAAKAEDAGQHDNKYEMMAKKLQSDYKKQQERFLLEEVDNVDVFDTGTGWRTILKQLNAEEMSSDSDRTDSTMSIDQRTVPTIQTLSHIHMTPSSMSTSTPSLSEVSEVITEEDEEEKPIPEHYQ